MNGWFCLTQRKIFAIEQKAPMTSIVGKNTTMEVNAAKKKIWLKTLLKISSFVFSKKRNLYRFVTNMMVSKC